MVNEHSPTGSVADLDPEVAAPARARFDPVLDAAALARLTELDPTGQAQLVERVLRAFQTSAARLVPQLEAAHAVGDHASTRLVAHTLKSSSASIGALRLSRVCAHVEALVRQGETDGLEPEIAELLEAMTEALRAIDTQLKGLA